MEKPLENLGFCMILIFSAKLLPNPKNVVLGRIGLLKMETRGAPNGPPRRQNGSPECENETQGHQDGPSECPTSFLAAQLAIHRAP